MTVSKPHFIDMMNVVVENLVFAHYHSQLARKLDTQDFLKIFSLAPCFWRLTLLAHNHTGVLRLCRAYDQDKTCSISLSKIINVIKSNYHNWNCSRVLEQEQLSLDSEEVSQSNALVKKLVKLRDQVVTHSDKKEALMYLKCLNKYEDQEIDQAELRRVSVSVFEELEKSRQEKPSWDEVQLLINRGIEICNRYSVIVGEPTVALSYKELDDYQNIVELLSSLKE